MDLAKQYDLHVCRTKRSKVVQIRKNPGDKYEDIGWYVFEGTLKSEGWPSTRPRKATSSR